ncbi:MAG: beta-galactosidase [Anaerolineae bacterium]|nr:beta-galactosidase [Anaerolineae bacterium]
MYYGVDYYPEHWPRERWETDARLMREAGLRVVRMAEFAWALIEPEEGRYDFGWLDDAIDLLARRDIETILCTPTATPPAWLCARYPEIMRVNRDGRRVTFGMRRQYCATSPIYRELSQGIVRAMAEHYADCPTVIGWQLDNEFGCHDSARCYCDVCRRAFAAWARGRYGTLDALNEAWGAVFWSHRYSSWDQIPLPWNSSGTSNPCLELDYWRFASDQTVAYQQLQIDTLRGLCPSHWITTNLMGMGFGDIDYHELARRLDFVSWDNYPLLSGHEPWRIAASHALMRGLKNANFWVMEQQAGPSGWETISRAPKPGQLRLWAYQAIAHGAEGMVFFRWRTCPFNTEEHWHGILDHHGQPGRRYEELGEMGQELARLDARLTGLRSPKAAAVLFSFDDGFAFRIQPNAEGFDYPRFCREIYRALHAQNVPVDLISPKADLSGYALVFAPALYMVDEELASRLTAYVQGGGHLLVGARSGVKTASNQVVQTKLPGPLRALCGIEVREYDALGRDGANRIWFEKDTRKVGGTECPVSTWCDILEPHDATVVARYLDDYYAGEAAITTRRYGEGRVTYFGVMGGQPLLTALASWCLEQEGLGPRLAAPEGVEVVWRESEAVPLAFVLNHTGGEQRVALPWPSRELISGALLSETLTLGPYQVAILEPGSA